MRTHEQRELTARLNALAEAPAPPAALDASAVIARGRVRLRRRRQALIGVAAGSTAAVLAGVLLLRPADGTPAPAVPAPTAAVSIAPSPTATPAPTAPTALAGPLSTEVHFGWLPEWLARSAVGYGTTDGVSVATASTTTAAHGVLPNLKLSLLRDPDKALAGQTKVTAPSVDGREAYWLNRDASSGNPLTLRWLTASGRWAELTAKVWPGAKVEGDLVKVAAGARFGSWDVPLPVRPSGLPADLKPRYAEVHRPAKEGEPPWSAILSYDLDGQWVSVAVQPDGFGVFADRRPSGGTPVCRVEKGVQLCATGSPAGIPSVQRIGGLPGLLTRFTVLGVDEGSWTP